MLKGLNSEVFDSQIIFRKMLGAMASPGSVMNLDIDCTTPENLHPTTGAILLTVLDFETPFWTDIDSGSPDLEWIKFHTGAPITQAKQKSLFALYTDYDNLDSPDSFNTGTIESPQHSTTLMIQTWGIRSKGEIRLTGPGIRTESLLTIKGIPETFWLKREEIYKEYPLGIDMIFICGSTFVAIPRTSKLEIL